MKIVILNGSPRKHGSTAYILRRMQDILKDKNAEVSYYDLCEYKIEPCRGCCGCYRTGHCFISDSADRLSLEIEEVDGIIVGSPTYASNVSGTLKNFIDRGHFVVEQLLHDKYAIGVITYENYGGKDNEKILNRLFSYSGAMISASMAIKVPFGYKNISESGLIKKIEKIVNRFYDDVAVRKKYVFQRMRHKLIFEIGIRPFVIRKGADYIGVLNRWKENGLAK